MYFLIYDDFREKTQIGRNAYRIVNFEFSTQKYFLIYNNFRERSPNRLQNCSCNGKIWILQIKFIF